MDCFCTNILYNFGSFSGTKLSEKYETISNCQQCHVSLPSKAHVHSGHSERLEAGSRKRKNKKPKEKENISILSAKTVSTGGCHHCCHGYKITNTYEGLHSSHRHLRKHGLFSGWLKIQTVWRQGDRTLLGGHCGIMGETWPRRGHAQQCCVWKNVKPKNEGAKWKTLQQSKRHTVRKGLTPDKIKSSKFQTY